jgi:hypothetical protein
VDVINGRSECSERSERSGAHPHEMTGVEVDTDRLPTASRNRKNVPAL